MTTVYSKIKYILNRKDIICVTFVIEDDHGINMNCSIIDTLLLRNVIERCFGILKVRFPIFKMMPNYPVRKQGQIPTAYYTVYNFIRMQHSQDRLCRNYSREDMIVDRQSLMVDKKCIDINVTKATQMAQVRETIVNQMWDNYRRLFDNYHFLYFCCRVISLSLSLSFSLSFCIF